MPCVDIRGVDFSYEEGHPVLSGIDLAVEPGEFVCLLGHSGCGKSTLLRLIAGLEAPSAGTIEIDRVPVRGAGLDRGVVFQDYGLYPWMSAGRNITLALEQSAPHLSRAERKERALEMLEGVGLAPDVFPKLPKELSGGMQQRCAIAQALAIDPPVLLMDEPFGALDAITRAKLQDLVRALWEGEGERKTIFFVTHDVDEAMLLGSRIVVLGQLPSSVIYDCRIGDDARSTRQSLFADERCLALRASLLGKINEDVSGGMD